MYLINIYIDLVKMLQIYIYIYTSQQYKCKCKRLKQVSDLHLHKIYTPAIDTYTHNTGKNLLLLKKSSTQNERNQQTGDS